MRKSMQLFINLISYKCYFSFDILCWQPIRSDFSQLKNVWRDSVHKESQSKMPTIKGNFDLKRWKSPKIKIKCNEHFGPKVEVAFLLISK